MTCDAISPCALLQEPLEARLVADRTLTKIIDLNVASWPASAPPAWGRSAVLKTVDTSFDLQGQYKRLVARALTCQCTKECLQGSDY